MKVHYLLDTHFGDYGQEVPTPARAKQAVDTLLDEARLADAGGFDGVLVPDRHARTETMAPAPLALLAALATVTERCQIGTYSLVLTLYPPLEVAEQAVLADLISGGRLVLSVSMGYHDAYFNQFGVDPRHRVSRFEESVEILRAAWRARPFSFAGKRFVLDDVICTPPPMRPEGVPLWFGGESPQMITRAATAGDGWSTGQAPLDRDDWLRRVEEYRTQADAAGRPSKVIMMRDGFVAPTYDEAARLAGDALVAEQLFYFRANATRRKKFPDAFASEADFTIDALRPHLVIGSPSDCVEQLDHLRRRYDVDEFVLRFRLPLGPPAGAVREAIQLFGAEVMPAFAAVRTPVT